VWDLKQSNFKSPLIFYDHEEEIISASASALGGQSILATMDVEGTVIVRDLKKNDILTTIKVEQSYESGFVVFNQKIREEFFVFFNNTLQIYHTDGALIQQKEFDCNIVKGIQEEDCILLSYENGTLASYDWYADKVVDEWENFGVARSMTLKYKNGSSTKAVGLVCGFDNGDIGILRKV